MSRSDRTRLHIMSATWELLEQRPGYAVTMAEIAKAAGVTRQLLYFHFANRTALLVEVSRLLDERSRTPSLQATIDNAPTGRAALHAAVRAQAKIKPRIVGLATSLELLAPNDEAAKAALDERESARLARCRAVIDRVVSDDDLASGWRPDTAAELLWSATSLRSWVDLVQHRSWSSKAWVERTTAMLEAALLR